VDALSASFQTGEQIAQATGQHIQLPAEIAALPGAGARAHKIVTDSGAREEFTASVAASVGLGAASGGGGSTMASTDVGDENMYYKRLATHLMMVKVPESDGRIKCLAKKSRSAKPGMAGNYNLTAYLSSGMAEVFEMAGLSSTPGYCRWASLRLVRPWQRTCMHPHHSRTPAPPCVRRQCAIALHKLTAG
jgi:hypothetical protein